MENQKAKEAFFAQYVNNGVFVFWEQNNLKMKLELTTSDFSCLSNNNKCFIVLKSLENISDEHAIKLGYRNAFCFLNFYKHCVITSLTREECDKLREWAYIIGFRQYSIKYIIDIGWAKTY